MNLSGRDKVHGTRNNRIGVEVDKVSSLATRYVQNPVGVVAVWVCRHRPRGHSRKVPIYDICV